MPQGVSGASPGSQRRAQHPPRRRLEVGQPGALVQTALEPYLGDSDRIHLDVPDLQLMPEAALTLALGFHELATNAAKYGALSSPTGRISLTAHVQSAENGEKLRIVWQ